MAVWFLQILSTSYIWVAQTLCVDVWHSTWSLLIAIVFQSEWKRDFTWERHGWHLAPPLRFYDFINCLFTAQIGEGAGISQQGSLCAGCRGEECYRHGSKKKQTICRIGQMFRGSEDSKWREQALVKKMHWRRNCQSRSADRDRQNICRLNLIGAMSGKYRTS